MKWLKECVLPVLMFCGTAKVMLNWRKAAPLQKKSNPRDQKDHRV